MIFRLPDGLYILEVSGSQWKVVEDVDEHDTAATRGVCTSILCHSVETKCAGSGPSGAVLQVLLFSG